MKLITFYCSLDLPHTATEFSLLQHKLVLFLCNTQVTHEKQSPITFMQLEGNTQFRTGILCVYTKKRVQIPFFLMPQSFQGTILRHMAKKYCINWKNSKKKNPNQTLKYFQFQLKNLSQKNSLKLHKHNYRNLLF